MKRSHFFNKKIVFAIACLMTAVLLLTGCRNTSDASAARKQITVQIVHRDGSIKDFSINTQEEFLGPALVAAGVVVNNRSTYGLFIVTADGETADDSQQEWWKVTKNGEMLLTGADDTAIADGEHYELTLTVGYES